MSVGSTTATCGQHILENTDLVGIMDGSSLAGGYNGYTIGSMVGSTFDKDVGDTISPHASLTSTEGSQVSPFILKETLTPLIHPNISEDNLLDDLFQQSSKGEPDIIDIMVSALHANIYSCIQLAHLSKLYILFIQPERH